MCLVYKISFKDCDEFYIGSTVNIYNRKKKHKYSCYNEKSKEHNYKLYQFIREHNYEWEDVIFVFLEEYETVLDDLELRKKEQSFMDKLKPTLNELNAYRTEEQHKKQKREIGIKYRKENKEEMREKDKKYYQENKEKIKEQAKIWYYKNQAKLNEKSNCDCGGKYTYSSKSKHKKTKLHQDYLANSNK